MARGSEIPGLSLETQVNSSSAAGPARLAGRLDYLACGVIRAAGPCPTSRALHPVRRCRAIHGLRPCRARLSTGPRRPRLAAWTRRTWLFANRPRTIFATRFLARWPRTIVVAAGIARPRLIVRTRLVTRVPRPWLVARVIYVVRAVRLVDRRVPAGPVVTFLNAAREKGCAYDSRHGYGSASGCHECPRL